MIFDEFVDADGTNVADHIISPTNLPSAVWLAVEGLLVIESNQASSLLGGSIFTDGDSVVLDASVSDCTISVDVLLTAGSFNEATGGIWARYADNNNFWLLSLRGPGQADQGLTLYEKIGGTYFSRVNASFAVSYGVYYTVKIVLAGTSLIGTVDGSNMVSYTSSDYQTNTQHGLNLYGSTGNLGDNFEITTP